MSDRTCRRKPPLAPSDRASDGAAREGICDELDTKEWMKTIDEIGLIRETWSVVIWQVAGAYQDVR